MDNMIANRYGKLTVISVYKKGKYMYCTCNCDCGTKGHSVRADLLKSGNTKSCGCLRKATQFKPKDIAGMRFGNVVAIKNTNNHRKYDTSCVWECKCDCGNIFFATVGDLRRGAVKSCGCSKYENTNKNMKKALSVFKKSI